MKLKKTTMAVHYYSYSPSNPQQAFGCSLVYGNQMEFKRWARCQGLSKENGADYYFDYVTPVDTRDLIQQKVIPGFLADGNTTWGEALNMLKKYFNIAT